MRNTRTKFYLVGLGLFLSFSPVANAKNPGCKEVATWVSENPESVPKDLKGLERMHPAYRRGAYRTYDAKTKLAVWKDHFQTFIESDRLTEAQKNKLIELRNSLKEATFQGSPQKNGFPSDESLKKEFGVDLTGAIFQHLGTSHKAEIVEKVALSENGSGALEFLFEDTGKKVRIAMGGGDDWPRSDCGCSQESTWCQGSKCWDYGTCDKSTSGCGTLWLYACNGICGDEASIN